jgi:hypothetical protein
MKIAGNKFKGMSVDEVKFKNISASSTLHKPFTSIRPT